MQAMPDDAPVSRAPGKQETIAVGFRLEVALVQAIDEEAEHMSPPGLRYTRSDALKILVREAIEARAKKRKPK